MSFELRNTAQTFLVIHGPILHGLLPLHFLQRGKSKSLNWTDAATASFKAMKEALANASLLTYPTPDIPTCLTTDASDTAVGVVLEHSSRPRHRQCGRLVTDVLSHVESNALLTGQPPTVDFAAIAATDTFICSTQS